MVDYGPHGGEAKPEQGIERVPPGGEGRHEAPRRGPAEESPALDAPDLRPPHPLRELTEGPPLVEFGGEDDREVVEALLDLPDDALLGCWCAPKRCHTEAVIEFARRLRDGV